MQCLARMGATEGNDILFVDFTEVADQAILTGCGCCSQLIDGRMFFGAKGISVLAIRLCLSDHRQREPKQVCIVQPAIMSAVNESWRNETSTEFTTNSFLWSG